MEVLESYEAVYKRALEVHSLANPVRENRALACVYLPEDLIEGMKTEVCVCITALLYRLSISINTKCWQGT